MKDLVKEIQQNFDKMCNTNKLFRSSITGQEVWDLYLQGFDPDPIFRDPESSVHNCNLCNNFIKRYGNIIALNEQFEIITIWDNIKSEEYFNSAKLISEKLKNSLIKDVFFETFNELNSLPYESCTKSQPIYKLGIEKNVKRYTKEEAEKFGVVKPNEIREFNHFWMTIPSKFVDKSIKSIESIMGEYRSPAQVFQRAMIEIPLDVLTLVRDLINQDSLLDGKTHLKKVEIMIILKAQYDTIDSDKRNNWCWVASYNNPFAKFKNELIGTLCSDLAEGVELNEACQTWNKRVDPANYMKAKAPITRRQIEEAKKFVEENEYEESFNRRFATINDIKASEILHMNIGDNKIKNASIFDNVKSTSTNHKKSEFDKVEEVHIEKFMKDILPTCTSVEAYFQNNHEGNIVSLTTANNLDSKKIFKWNNNYSWTFKGNLAGKSMIKEAVKTAGGRVDGILRFSIIWNESGKDILDFDAHCKTPYTEICFSNRKDNRTGGWLDVDMIRPDDLGVENITWQNKSKMLDGDYVFYNKNYDGGSNSGFKAEIEIEGTVYTYEINTPCFGNTHIATVTLKNGTFSIKHLAPCQESSKEIYGLDTNQFHKVNLVCLSPNHWDGQEIGNKYYFFMLDKCKCNTSIRSFHNENLNSDLLQHRKVMEVLANTTMIEPTDEQLSGLGFNATVRDELIVKVKGSFQRIIKIKF